MHIRIGGVRYDVRATGSVVDAADLLASLTRANVRRLRDDAVIREEAMRRILSPPCFVQCRTVPNPFGPDTSQCGCDSGFQYMSDEAQQRLEGCAPNDVWSDVGALLLNHRSIGHSAGKSDAQIDAEPIPCDCDDLLTAALGGACYLAWYGSGRYQRYLDPEAEFAAAITRPPNTAPPGQPPNNNMAHAYGLVTRRPEAPQPEIQLRDRSGKIWWVWDQAAHWGMPRPSDAYYGRGVVTAFPVIRPGLDGIEGLKTAA